MGGEGGGVGRGWGRGGGNGWLSSACPNSGVGEKERGEDLAGCPGVQFLKPGAAAAVVVVGSRGGIRIDRRAEGGTNQGPITLSHCQARDPAGDALSGEEKRGERGLTARRL